MGLAAFALVSGLVRVGNYARSLSPDPAQFLYVGETIGHGGMPYADAAFSKGPLTAVLFAVIDPLVGTSPSAVRLTLVPFAALTALALAGYVAHHAGRAAGALAGLVFAALSGIGNLYGAEGQSEQYGVAPMFGALWLATRRGAAATASAGALVACAILIHPALGVVVLPVAAELWLGTPRGARARRLLVAAAGALVPSVMTVVWLATGGALDDALAQIGEQIRSSGSTDVSQPLEQAWDGGGGGVLSLPDIRSRVPATPLWVMALVACGVAARVPRLRGAVAVLFLTLGAVLLRVKLASYEFPYQYYPAVPAIAGVIALAIASAWPRRPVDRVALTAVVLAFPLWVLVVSAQQDLLSRDPPLTPESTARSVPVADFLRAHTAPAEQIFVAGARAEVYWLAERRAPTRFFDTFGLTSAADVAERDRDLARTPPAAVAVVYPYRLHEDPGVTRLVHDEGYVLAYDSAGSRVWLRRPR